MSGAGGAPGDRRPEVFLSEGVIADRVEALAREIAAVHPRHPRHPGDSGRALHLLVVLRGAFVFAADLARRLGALGVELTLDFCRVSTYGDDTEPGVPAVELPDAAALAGREVLIVEDILDTGFTLAALRRAIAQQATPRSLGSVALLSKPARRRIRIEADFTGFVVPDRFLVGYGLDHAGRYRQLPYIGVLEPG